MWFSSGGTKSVFHHDDVDNINCLYRGSKTLLFVDYQKYKIKVCTQTQTLQKLYVLIVFNKSMMFSFCSFDWIMLGVDFLELTLTSKSFHKIQGFTIQCCQTTIFHIKNVILF